MITDFINKNRLSSGFNEIAKTYYIPLSESIMAHQKSARKPYFVGINGSQGSGKSTLSAFIQDYLQQTHDLKVVVMSLDDFYLSQEEREKIANHVHPLFKTRGVPGTHNMEYAKQVINGLKDCQPVLIPRFNKATDNPFAQKNWTRISEPVDLVIFEGWCWGVEAQTSEQLIEPVNLFEQQEDNQGQWRRYANSQLALHYQPLYQLMDEWLMLKAPSFHDIFSWRLEQEQKLLQATPLEQRAGIMNPKQVERFIQHYQRLTEHGLLTLADKCDHVFSLNSARQITAHHFKESNA